MRLNIEKCKIMHVGKKNIQHNYSMIKYDNEDRLVLKKTQTEKDLGVLFSNDLKSTAQSNQAASNGNKKLDMLKSTLRHRGADKWKKL